MTTETRRKPAVGMQIKRWRAERGLTLANVAERSGLNVGYLSQIENDKASPSLAVPRVHRRCAGGADRVVPRRRPARPGRRPCQGPARDRVGARPPRARRWADSREVSILEVTGRPGGRVGAHAHAGDEHHLILRGRFRLTQGEHVVEAGPGDYVRWDGTIPHDGEVIGDDDAAMLIIRIRPGLTLGRRRTIAG